MHIAKQIRPLLAASFFVLLSAGCAASFRDGTVHLVGGEGEIWNGDSGRLALLRAQAYLANIQSMAVRIQAQGPGSASFFDRDNCDSSNENCLALRALPQAEYDELKAFALYSLPHLLALSNEAPTLQVELANEALYPDASAPAAMHGVQQYMMSNFATKTVRLAPRVADIDRDNFGMLFAHELGHLIRLANGSHYGFDHEAFLMAYAAGIMMALGDKPPPFDLDTSLNYQGAQAAVCKNGIVCPPIGGQTSLSGLALQTDGKMLLAGTSIEGVQTSQIFVMRLLPDGKLDTTFGSGGIVQARVGNEYTYGGPVVALADGVLVLGTVKVASSWRLAFLKLSTNGGRYPGYGTNGFLVEPDYMATRPGAKPRLYYINSLATVRPGPNGTTLAGGSSCFVANGNKYCAPLLVRLTADGQFDGTFGNNNWRPGGGIAEVPARSYSERWILKHLTTDSAGRIVATGGRGSLTLLVRWTGSGQHDATFGGSLGFSYGQGILGRTDTACVTERGIVVGGAYSSNALAGAMLLNENGTAADSTFGTGDLAGRTDLDIRQFAYETVPYSRGRTLLAVQRPQTTTAGFALIDSAGKLLPFVTTSGATGAAREVSFLYPTTTQFLQPQRSNGLIVVAGTMTIQGQTRPFVARYWPPWE